MVLDDATVRVQADSVTLEGNLSIPYHAQGLVIFAHGSGSSRRSSRNRYVASELNRAGLATLLFDLLTPQEELVDQLSREFRFDIPLLSQRLVGSIDWARDDPHTRGLPIGLFGASTGAAATLVAAAHRPDDVAAVVSRGGRPDLAGDALPHVRCPVLLIVGTEDGTVIELNENAMRHMTAPVRLHLIPGATHLFEEPGTLEEVARLARDFFAFHLGGAAARNTYDPASMRNLHHTGNYDAPPTTPL
jgi:dienelactone hydrolase